MVQIINLGAENALFFDLPPNWRDSVQKGWAYKTDMFKSYAGVEQRRALRSTARSTLTFTVSETQDDFRELAATLAGWQRRLFLVADPARYVQTVTALAPGLDTLQVDKVAPWVREGGRVALEYKGRMAYRRLLDVQGVILKFDDTGTQNWPIGTKVRFLHEARLDSGVTLKKITGHTAEAVLDFSVEPLSAAYQAVGAPIRVFDGCEVFLKRPNWGQPITSTIAAQLEILDRDRGARIVRAPTGFSARTHKALYLARDGQEADEVEAFFHRQKGRRGTFYMPVWEKNFVPVLPLAQGSNRFILSQADLDGLFKDDTANRGIAILTKRGDWLFNRVVNYKVTQGGWGYDYGLNYGRAMPLEDSSRITLELRDPWPRNVPIDQIVYATWMAASRFASDSLTFEYETESVVQFNLSIEQIRDDGADLSVSYGWGLNYGNAYGGSV